MEILSVVSVGTGEPIQLFGVGMGYRLFATAIKHRDQRLLFFGTFRSCANQSRADVQIIETQSLEQSAAFKLSHEKTAEFINFLDVRAIAGGIEREFTSKDMRADLECCR